MAKTGELFEEFVEVVRRLRDPNGGCPWDLEQTHQTLRPYLIEEAYEVLDAIDAADDGEFAQELGDLLLQVVLHSQVAFDRKAFKVDQVIQAATAKMIRRHPHVFGTAVVEGASDVLKNWEQIKKSEKKGKTQNPETPNNGTLDGIPRALPALLRAQRIGEKAAQVGFDWRSVDGVREKVNEELAELDMAIAGAKESPSKPFTTAPNSRSRETHQAIESELGDLLFSVCQLARWLGVSAEDALRGTIDRFTLRFDAMEKSAEKPLRELTDAQLEDNWQKTKRSLKDGNNSE